MTTRQITAKKGNALLLVGTLKGGKLWGSRDGGRAFSLLADGLPSVVCVKAAVVR